ncbi:hypothetical protein [Streptomyces sp. NPDC005438]|uniref:hypothetical protein n=1 Tax=Streptomyces sp. NPDC005438 TaxID=3156880 RepID=UPI0033B7E36C
MNAHHSIHPIHSIHEEPLYRLAPHSPWRELVRHRWSGRRDRALVLRDQMGTHYLCGAGRSEPRDLKALPDTDGYGGLERPDPKPRLFHRYQSAYHVDLGERSGTRNVALPTAAGTESLEIHYLWWVGDPVRVVRSGCAFGTQSVRADIDRRLRGLDQDRASQGRPLRIWEVTEELDGRLELEGPGLVYRVTDVRGLEAETELRLGPSGESGPPYSWTANRREDYTFCLRALRDGPASLAAMWLVRHPEQVSQVLDWSVSHGELLRGEPNWEDQVAGMLAALTQPEREELSRLLRDRLVALGRRVPGAKGATSGPNGRAPHSGRVPRAETAEDSGVPWATH